MDLKFSNFNTMSDEKKPMPPADSPASEKNKAEVIKDKFLLVAKEKSQLESVILEQSDSIKNLEKERDSLAHALNNYTESNNRLKEKLLELDQLRNSEISELRMKIELLLAENKKLIDEQEDIRGEKPEREAARSAEAKSRSSRLPDTVRELKNLLDIKEQNLSASTERIRQLEQEISSLRAGLKNIETERNSLKDHLAKVSGKLDSSGPEKKYSEQEFEQEVDFYSKEILSLKSDIEVLTSTIKEKTRQTETLNKKVEKLAEYESAKYQAETENADLRNKLFILLTEKQNIEAAKNHLETKMAGLSSELAGISSHDEAVSLRISKLEEAKQALEANIRSNLAVLESKDQFIMETNAELEDLKTMVTSLRSSKQEADAARYEVDSDLAHLRNELEESKTQNTEYGQSIEKLQDEKQEIESRLSKSSQKIEKLGADTLTNQALLGEKDKALSEVIAKMDDLKIMFASLRSSKQDLEVANNQLEAELAQLRAGVPDLKAEVDLLRSEKQRIAAEKDQIDAELADLRSQFADIRSGDAEISQSIRALEDEKQEIESRLSTALQKIEKLEADTSSQALLGEKDNALATVTAEMEDLKIMFASLRSSKQDLEVTKNQLEAELVGLRAAVPDLKAEVDLLRSEKQRIAAEKDQIDAELADLRSQFADIRSGDAEISQSIRALKDEKQEIESRLSTALQKIEEMEEEINKHVSAFLSHEQMITKLNEEIGGYQSGITSLTEESFELKNRLTEKEQAFAAVSSEKSDLLKKIDILEEAFKLIGKRASGGSAAEDMLRQAAGEQSLSERPANIVPTGVSRDRKISSVPKYALMAVILIAVLAGLIYFNKHYPFYKIARQRPPVTVEVDANLGYREIYDRNTRAADSKNIKIQATVFTESMLRKEENFDLAGFDFNKYVYFKVNINSLEGPLDPAMLRNPLDSLKLTEDTKTISTSGYKQIDKIKTFYKRQVPVSITFFCAFPKSELGPDRKDLTLTLTDKGDAIPLVWDVRSLIANKI